MELKHMLKYFGELKDLGTGQSVWNPYGFSNHGKEGHLNWVFLQDQV